MPVVSLAEVKRHLQMSPGSGPDDDELTFTAEAAAGIVEGFVGPLSAVTVTETFPSDRYRHLSPQQFLLRRAPVTAVTAVTGLSGWRADLAAGIVYPQGCVPSGPVSVTYTAGLDPVPAAVRLAVLIVTAHLWETQRGSGSPLAPDGVTPGVGFAVPNRAQELLAPWRLLAVTVA